MRIRGRVVSKGEPIADAKVCIRFVKRSDSAEILAFEGSSVDDGTFETSQDVLDGLPCNSRHFVEVKYSVEWNGYQTAQGSWPIVSEETDLRDIDLVRNALRVQGRVTSNGRPVRAAKIIVHIDEVERACIHTDNAGIFKQEIEGSYESRKLVWTARRFGYITATGSISEIRSNVLDLREIDLTPHWWIGICQNFGVDPQVVPGVLLSLGLGLALVIWWLGRCPDSSMVAADFTKSGASVQDRQTNFNECVFIARGKCGEEKDGTIRRCMENPNRSYTYSK
jgi:hypothetical protein